MKLLLIGATGRIGRVVLAEALRRGYHVTALARHLGSLATYAHPNLTVAEGNLLQPTTLGAVVPGHDAVVLVAGGRGPAGTTPLAAGTANLIWQLQCANVQRLVVLSRQGAGASLVQMSRWWRWTTRRFNRHRFADHDQQEENVRQSGLAWTIVRASELTDGPATGYVAAPTCRQLPAAARLRLARADVAAFLLDQLVPGAPVRCALTLAGAPAGQAARGGAARPNQAWRYAGGAVAQ